MGDGELTEGSIWEASACAAHYHLDNLVAIIDRNTLQISGRTEIVMAMEPLEEKFTAFGYAVRHVDGNKIADLVDLLKACRLSRENRIWFWHIRSKEKPSVLWKTMSSGTIVYPQIRNFLPPYRN